MDNKKWKDDLTPFERTVYRRVSYSALAVVFYCVLMVRKYPTSTFFFVIGLFALVIAMVFGGGYSKSVRVLDLRRFDRRSGERNSRGD
jgi:asparagine N-glycosylation enzyme membrane subunit Stt3